MPFRFSDRHIEEYYTLGYTVFRGLLPTSLLADLRRAAEPARALARSQKGPLAQRLQPLGAYDLDLRPFQAYHDLPELNAGIQRLLCRPFQFIDMKKPQGLGLLLEPVEQPWCTNWHRDWRDHTTTELRPFVEALYLDKMDRSLFNQINCPLYADDCTWVVPGSHLRADLPGEVAAFPDQPPPGPVLDGLGMEARERACLEYCRRMPGAVRLCLDAGDFAFYRDILWHLGNYVPYRKRVTIHDCADTSEYAAFRTRNAELKRAVQERKQAVAV